MKRQKTFDCIKMKDEAQLRRAELLRGMTPSERLEFYRREHEELLNRQKQLRQLKGGTKSR